MKSEKETVSVRIEVDKEIHRKVKLIQAKMLLNGKESSITNLCAELLRSCLETQKTDTSAEQIVNYQLLILN